MLLLFALPPMEAHAQWWTADPADFEDCADRVERSSLVGESKASAIAICESRFAGRRKRGGGYTYHDFMQNRTFDIAGPNPTAAEQKIIDEQYAAYLNDQRRNIIQTAFAKRQSEAQPQPAPLPDFRDDAPTVAAVAKPVPVALPRPRPAPRIKGPNCAVEPLACGWSKLSSGLKDLKNALFGPSATPKTKRT